MDCSVTVELLDSYEFLSPDRLNSMVMVYEKHYWRAGNRLTLTVTIDNMSGRTRVHTVGGGGGEGLFRFDWGASQSFEGVVQDVLTPYML